MASKNLVLKGATWNGVESVDFPVSGGGTARYVETSDADAAAGDIASGKKAYVNGSLITGTASGGGGGGLEYETGTWTPTSDVSEYTIQFTDAHTVAPFFYCIVDATNTYDDTLQSNGSVTFVNWNVALGAIYYASATGPRYGLSYPRYRASSASGDTASVSTFSGLSGSSDSYADWWATSSGIKATSKSSSRYWRAGRTYKWIAVWAPTS